VDLAQLAQRQLDDFDAHHPGLIFEGDSLSLTQAEAYDLQFKVAALRESRGEQVAGYKIGCMSETVRRQLGLNHPVFGHVFQSELHSSGCVLDPNCYEGLAIEGEFAVRIGEDIERSVSPAFPVIELHNYIFRSSTGAAQELIGNNAIHAGVVLPATESFSIDPEDLQHEPISVWINGELQGTSDGSAAPEVIGAALLSVTRHLERFGSCIKKGQIVLTGSPLPLYRVEPGDQVEVRFWRFPPVTASIMNRAIASVHPAAHV
jgi:2-keto-4-pentenoate hydratase